MESTSAANKVLAIMAERTDTDVRDWYLVFKARLGMLATFEAIRKAKGDGCVATQLLTCCTAVDPIVAAGLHPRYAEISPDTAMIDPGKLDLSSDTRAVAIQHTYGLIDDDDSALLAERAHTVGALVVEDCAHGVARMAHDAGGKPVADVSIHSFGVEKILDCSFGGAVWINPDTAHTDVAGLLRARLGGIKPAGKHLDFLARHFIFENRVFNHLPSKFSLSLRHGLAHVGLFEPAVSELERRGGVSHELMRPSEFMCTEVVRAFGLLDADMDKRRRVVEVYRRELCDIEGVEVPAGICKGAAQSLIKFPILVADTATADAVVEACINAGYYTSVWYRPELGPGVLDEAPYELPADRSGLVENDHFVACVATLPTNIDEEGARKVVEVVREIVAR